MGIKRIRSFLNRLFSPYLLIDLLLKEYLLLFHKHIHGRVVDFGCGDFRLSRLFLDRMESLYGIDNWVASNCHRSAPSEAVFFYASVEKSPFNHHSFNTLMCTEVLEHVTNEHSTLKESSRVLKPEGIFILSMPFNFFVHGAPNDFRRYTIFGLEKLLEEHGFEIIEYAQVGNALHAILVNVTTFLAFNDRTKLWRPLCLLLLAVVNALGYCHIKYLHQFKSFEKIDRKNNDRTNPLGYVIVARKKVEETADWVPDSDEIVVCPDCYSTLVFLDDAVQCKGCGKRYRYHEGVPVLGDVESLHLEYEVKNEKVQWEN